MHQNETSAASDITIFDIRSISLILVRRKCVLLRFWRFDDFWRLYDDPVDDLRRPILRWNGFLALYNFVFHKNWRKMALKGLNWRFVYFMWGGCAKNVGGLCKMWGGCAEMWGGCAKMWGGCAIMCVCVCVGGGGCAKNVIGLKSWNWSIIYLLYEVNIFQNWFFWSSKLNLYSLDI